MSAYGYDMRAFRIGTDGTIREVPIGESKIECEADAALDRAFIDSIAREERRSIFRCRECNGIAHHHPNCPNADDGHDDEQEEA